MRRGSRRRLWHTISDEMYGFSGETKEIDSEQPRVGWCYEAVVLSPNTKFLNLRLPSGQSRSAFLVKSADGGLMLTRSAEGYEPVAEFRETDEGVCILPPTHLTSLTCNEIPVRLPMNLADRNVIRLGKYTIHLRLRGNYLERRPAVPTQKLLRPARFEGEYFGASKPSKAFTVNRVLGTIALSLWVMVAFLLLSPQVSGVPATKAIAAAGSSHRLSRPEGKPVQVALRSSHRGLESSRYSLKHRSGWVTAQLRRPGTRSFITRTSMRRSKVHHRSLWVKRRVWRKAHGRWVLRTVYVRRKRHHRLPALGNIVKAKSRISPAGVGRVHRHPGAIARIAFREVGAPVSTFRVSASVVRGAVRATCPRAGRGFSSRHRQSAQKQNS